MGGGDPVGNPRLRLAIDKAKSGNMPADNIKRAIMKGTGELPGMAYEDIAYEAYGPGGVALIIECVTDNKTRTVSEMRHLLDRHHGKLASSGAVAYQFHRKGVITIPRHATSEDDLMATILDANADDMNTEDDFFSVYCSPEAFEGVRKAIESKGIQFENAELQLIPENTIKVEGKDAENMIKLMEVIEDHDDVQHVYSNFEIDDKVMASLGLTRDNE